MKHKGILTNQSNQGDIDLAILFAKNKISILRYALQREEFVAMNSSNKTLNKLRQLRIQLNGYTISDLEVEDTTTQTKVGEDMSPTKKIEVDEVPWEDIIGQEEAKKRLRDEAVRYLGTYDSTTKKSIFESVLGTKPPKAILLFGPPGTGKTMTLKAVITEAEKIKQELSKNKKIPAKRIHWDIITPDMIKNKYIGESAKSIKRVFDTAKKEAPSLLVIDEIDALSTRRCEEGFNEG